MIAAATLTVPQARRLALARAGLLNPERIGLPRRANGTGKRARAAAQAVVDHFGYLQLDTVSIAGARSHALVLHSRLDGATPELAESLLVPGAPLFEYWGHEACWMPLDLYPVFGFRRAGIRASAWWKRGMKSRARLARTLVERIREDGPVRSADLEGKGGGGGWWDHKPAKDVAVRLWWTGELAIRERRNFQRVFDVPERVIPDALRERTVSRDDALPELLLRALAGHGWATTGTLAGTWRLSNLRPQIAAALNRLVEVGEIVPCSLVTDGRPLPGWIRPGDLELADELRRVRPRTDRGVLLSPFDPVLWDRKRVALLFGFDQVLEIFKPKEKRLYGYFCLPVLAGDRLIARVDLKADQKAGRCRVLSRRFESTGRSRAGSPAEAEALRTALERHGEATGLSVS